jgi:hypothetical protein
MLSKNDFSELEFSGSDGRRSGFQQLEPIDSAGNWSDGIQANAARCTDSGSPGNRTAMPPTTTTGRQTSVNIDAATRSTTAGFGYANRALAPRAEGLQLLADQPVDRIDAAAADSDGQADGPNQKHVFISAGAGRITVWQMHEQQSHQHLDSERRREKARE